MRNNTVNENILFKIPYFPDKQSDDNTLVAQFEELIKESPCLGDAAIAISVLNAKALSANYTGEMLVNLVNYIYRKYGDDKDLIKRISYIWPDGPQIFRLAKSAAEECIWKTPITW